MSEIDQAQVTEAEEAVDLGPIIPEEGLVLSDLLELIEVEVIKEALSKTSTITEAAKLIGLNRATLSWKLGRYGIPKPGSES